MQVFDNSVPGEMRRSIELMIDLALAHLRAADEAELLRWGFGVKEHFQSQDFQNRLGFDLTQAKSNLRDRESGGDPVPYRLLVDEFAVYGARRLRIASGHESVDHGLDLGDILVESLEKLLNGFPISSAVLSLIRELIKVAKAISRRQS